jgi:hypothetical protein
MIITNKIKVRISYQVIDYYKNLGFTDIKNGDEIEISVNNLPTGSKIKIKVKCDICGSSKTKPYREYLTHISNQNFYACNKCKSEKSKQTLLKKYGVEHPLQNKEIMSKFKQTIKEKYGVDNVCESEEIRKKIKTTIRKIYGVDYIFQDSNFIEKSQKIKLKKYKSKNNFVKISETKLNRYGDKNYNNREKSLKTLSKFGVENVSQLDYVKEKKIKTCQDNFGVDFPTQSKEILQRIIDKNISKIGVEFPMKSEIVKNKTYITNVSNGRWTPYEKRADFYNYTLAVYKFTRLNEKELFEKWTGYDYYDNKYILNNMTLNSNDIDFPTIDHKISIRNGFKNNIPPCFIGEINNLCITSRRNNSCKNRKNEKEFNIYREQKNK